MIRPFEAKDLEDIDLSPEHRELARRVAPALMDLVAPGLAKTLVTASGRPVVVFGAAPVADDECEVFIFPSRGRAQHRASFWRGTKAMVDYARGRFKRVRAVSKNETVACDFLARLGFAPGPVHNAAARPETAGMRGWVLA